MRRNAILHYSLALPESMSVLASFKIAAHLAAIPSSASIDNKGKQPSLIRLASQQHYQSHKLCRRRAKTVSQSRKCISDNWRGFFFALERSNLAEGGDEVVYKWLERLTSPSHPRSTGVWPCSTFEFLTYIFLIMCSNTRQARSAK